MRTVVAALAVATLALAGCSSHQARTLPPPSSTSSTEVAPSTTEPDWSRIPLPEIDGTTTSTVPLAEGRATLRGVVQGPDGPVPGAVVRAERLVRDAVQRLDVRAGNDGVFILANVPGGRYRVRAFLPPTLATVDPEIFFHEDGETRDLRLVVEPFGGLVVDASTTPRGPIVGDGVNLAVRVAERRVDEDGFAREVPQAGVPVRVNASGWTSLDRPSTTTTSDPRSLDPGPTDPVVVTDGDGIAVFEFRCDRVTSVTATAIVGEAGEVFPLDVPPCSPVPTTTTTTTTTTEPGDDDDDGGTSPSTTSR